MITLNNNEANTIITYYDAPEQYFLFEFKSGYADCEPIYIIKESESNCTAYQKFVIDYDFPVGGVWTVSTYNQASPVSINPNAATLLETQQVNILIDTYCVNAPPPRPEDLGLYFDYNFNFNFQ